MFRLLATKKYKRREIAILIISFFTYVAGIRNEGNNMLLQQQQQEQQATIENFNYGSSIIDKHTTLKLRSWQMIHFTPADAVAPQKAQYSTNNNKNINVLQEQETENVNRRHRTEEAAKHETAAEKKFSFPNEQQQIPQHLIGKPIYVYRDQFTSENYHNAPTEANTKYTKMPNINDFNNNKRQNSFHQLQQDGNQEYLVQSSMMVGAHQQPEANTFGPYMSLSADREVYLKRPGFVYDEKPSKNHLNLVLEKKNLEDERLKADKISYDSHDYPPPSYFQQYTSNFLPKPELAQPSTSIPELRSTSSPAPPPKQDFKPTVPTQSKIFGQRRPQQQYLQPSQSTLPNYANSIDNYLLNKQQTSGYYHTELPSLSYSQQKQPQIQHQYDDRPFRIFEYDSKPPYGQQHQYYSSSPSYSSLQSHTSKPSYSSYYDYLIGEIPPQPQTKLPPSQQFNYPYPRPPPQYPYQRPYRPPPPTLQLQQSGLAALAQYAPQFTSFLLNGVGGGGGGFNTNGPLGNLVGALTGAATSQQSPSSSSSSSSLYSASSASSHNRRPVNSQLIKALENIARNDDLQCVPKVLCQMIAAQTQRGQLPTFITSPAITNFLASFPAASPALIYGRAALLGFSGGAKSCHQTYVMCPKNEDEIIYYLNNHRGGFFKFFNEPEEQQQTVNHDYSQQSPTSLFSILAALNSSTKVTTTTPRPKPKPQAPSADTTCGIGNFFTQLLSGYIEGATVEYQRRSKRKTKRSLDDKIKFEGENENPANNKGVVKFLDKVRESQTDVIRFEDEYHDIQDSYQNNEESFHDEENEEDQSVDFKDNDEFHSVGTEVSSFGGEHTNFFPKMREQTSGEFDKDGDELQKVIKKFNDFSKTRKMKFPAASNEANRVSLSYQNTMQGNLLHDNVKNKKFNYFQNSHEDIRNKTEGIQFTDNDVKANAKNTHTLNSNYMNMRWGKILNRRHYEASYLQKYKKEKQFEESNKTVYTYDQFNETPLHYIEFPSTSSTRVYNTNINSLQSHNTNSAVNNNIYVTSLPANINTNNSHFLPTPTPFYYTSSKLIHPNKDSNDDNHNILKQNSLYKPQKSPSTGNSNFFKLQQFMSVSQTNYNRYYFPQNTTRHPFLPLPTTAKSEDQKIYVTNSQGATEYYITPEDRKVYL